MSIIKCGLRIDAVGVGLRPYEMSERGARRNADARTRTLEAPTAKTQNDCCLYGAILLVILARNSRGGRYYRRSR